MAVLEPKPILFQESGCPSTLEEPFKRSFPAPLFGSGDAHSDVDRAHKKMVRRLAIWCWVDEYDFGANVDGACVYAFDIGFQHVGPESTPPGLDFDAFSTGLGFGPQDSMHSPTVGPVNTSIGPLNSDQSKYFFWACSIGPMNMDYLGLSLGDNPHVGRFLPYGLFHFGYPHTYACKIA
ncbi:hypothetical protein L1987_87980 [Smallanthus sonchifolius]|nr:hypothetical protein L1987_87980 [Smallanthus sonchifolius]